MGVHKVARYGYIQDSLDHRDEFLPMAVARVKLPPACDLVGPHMPPVYDQGQVGSCTGNSSVAAFEFERSLQGLPFLAGSRLFPYYNARVMEGNANQDAGAQIRDVVKSLAKQGLCPESDWPYDEARVVDRPTPQAYADAIKHEALKYSRVTQSRYFLHHCAAILGRPIIFGFSVFAGFESDAAASTGVVPMPGKGEAPIGGHAVLVAGYDDARQAYKCRNSWGVGWGLGGYFWLPYAYVESPSLASDFWVILTDG